MITFVLAILSYLTGTPVPGSVYWLTGIIDGLVFVPLFSIVLAPVIARAVREKMGRLHYLQAVYSLPAVVLVLAPWGYEFAPGDPETDAIYLSNGETLPYGEVQSWYRLGNRRFGITYHPEAPRVERLRDDLDDVQLASMAVTDGGEQRQVDATYDIGGVLKRQRGGTHGWTPYTDGPPEDGIVVSLSRAINSLKEAGGVGLSEHTERMTRIAEGGGSNLSNRARAIAYTGVILVSSMVGLLIFGVLS